MKDDVFLICDRLTWKRICRLINILVTFKACCEKELLTQFGNAEKYARIYVLIKVFSFKSRKQNSERYVIMFGDELDVKQLNK